MKIEILKRKYIIVTLKILSVIFTFLLSSFIYKKVFWLPEIKDQGPLLFKLEEFQWHNDGLYFGESSDFWIADSDTDRRTISDILNDSLNGPRVSGISMSAYHAGNYRNIIERLKENSKVKFLIVTMNLRSFDKPWIYSDLERNLNRANCFYQSDNYLFNRLCAAFQYYHNPTPKEQEFKMLYCFEFDTLKVNFALKHKTIKTWCEEVKFPLLDGSEDMPKRILADHYIKAYAFQIDTNTNPRIKDFDAITDFCNKRKIQVFYHILSENTHYADSLVGKELVYFMKANRDLLVYRYTQKGAVVIDNLETVNPSSFGEKNWTTEHYDQFGRKSVAIVVRDSVQKHWNKNVTKVTK